MALLTDKSSLQEIIFAELTLRSNTQVERRASALAGPGGCHHPVQMDSGQWAIPLAECWFGRRSPASLLCHSVSWKRPNIYMKISCDPNTYHFFYKIISFLKYRLAVFLIQLLDSH
jgi:hypothetical protein